MCDSELSFIESKQTVPALNAIISDFFSRFLIWKKMLCFLAEIFVKRKCLVFFECVPMYLSVGVKHRGKKSYVYELSSNGANKPVLVSVELSWVWMRTKPQ